MIRDVWGNTTRLTQEKAVESKKGVAACRLPWGVENHWLKPTILNIAHNDDAHSSCYDAAMPGDGSGFPLSGLRLLSTPGGNMMRLSGAREMALHPVATLPSL